MSTQEHIHALFGLTWTSKIHHGINDLPMGIQHRLIYSLIDVQKLLFLFLLLSSLQAQCVEMVVEVCWEGGGENRA
jgi:hypothetical protein